jgi:tryptophan synthase alpha chain
MPYLMGGYPDLDSSRECVLAAAEAGADLVELGVPYSDPLADGPVIHGAGTRALEAGVRPADVLDLCEAVADRVPIVLMVYANVVMHSGGEAYARRAAEAGAAGLIVPDLPHEEAQELREACDSAGIALVPLVAPTTPADRVEAIAADARGFVYTVAVTGTTGERAELPQDLSRTVARVRAVCELPVAVGFGISSGEQARAVAEIADGVIVGTRIVRAAGEGGPEGVAAVVAELGDALR